MRGNVWELMKYTVFDAFDILHMNMQHDNIYCILNQDGDKFELVAILFYKYYTKLTTALI